LILLVLGAGVLYWLVKAPPKGMFTKTLPSLVPAGLLLSVAASEPNSVLWKIAGFFLKAGAFVFGSGLAIVPFLYGGVVKDFQWLNEQQFLDAVAVAMITPGPVVITVGFIGYLVAGLPGASVAALATFLPCYLFTVIPAPYFKKYGKRPGIKAFVDGVTLAAVGAIAGAVIVLAKRQLWTSATIGDWLPFAMAISAALVLYRFPKVSELYVIGASAALGLGLKLVL